jgi:hypothetical protein
MKSRRFSLAVAFALALFFVFAYGRAPLMKPSTAALAPAEDKPFKGKVVLVCLKSNHSLPLEHAQVRKLGERSFLVGKGSDDGQPGNWTKGHINWVPMDRVEMIVEFDSVEEMKKAWEEYQKNAPVPPPGAIH